MKKALILAGAALIAAAPVSAAGVSSLFNAGDDNVLQDISGEIVVRNGQVVNSGPLQVGDLLVAAFKIDTVNGTDIGAGTGYNELTGVSVIKIASIGTPNPVTGRADYVMTAPTQLEYTSTTGISAAAGTMVQLFEDAAKDWTLNTTAGILGAFATASNGILRAEIGFNGSADEYWIANTLTDLGGFSTGLLATSKGTFDYQLSLLSENFNDVNFFDLPGLDVEFAGTGGLFRPNSDNPFPVENNLTFGFNADVPEPASLGLLGLGLAAVGLGRRRRKAA